MTRLPSLSLGKPCEEHGDTCEWASGQKPHLTNKGKRIPWKTENVVPGVVPGLSSSSSASSSSTTLPQDHEMTMLIKCRQTDAILRKNYKEAQQIKQRAVDWEISQSGWRSSQITSKIQKCQDSQTLLKNQIRNVLRQWHPGSMVFVLTFLKTELAKSASEPWWQGLLAEGELAKYSTSGRKVWWPDNSRPQGP